MDDSKVTEFAELIYSVLFDTEVKKKLSVLRTKVTKALNNRIFVDEENKKRFLTDIIVEELYNQGWNEPEETEYVKSEHYNSLINSLNDIKHVLQRPRCSC